jgi:L-ribulose-5-phosphate 3-epimerase
MKAAPLGIVQGRLSVPPAGQLQWFPQECWEEEFPTAARLGLDFIEYLAEKDHNPRNPIWSDAGVGRMKELAKTHGIRNLAICNNFPIAHDLRAEESLRQSLALVERGKALGIEKIILPLFESSEVRAADLEAYAVPVRKIAYAGENAGIRIGLETSLRPREWIDLHRMVGSANVYCVYDVGNRVVDADLPTEILELGGHIGQVHLKDKNEAGENVLFGTGRVNFLAVFRALEKIGYRGPFTFETARGKDPVRTARFHKALVDFFAAEAE